MKKVFLLIFLFFSANILVHAQTADTVAAKDTLKYWEFGGFSALNFNQVSLTNWAQGGESSIATTGLFSMFYNYRSDKQIWDNLVDIAYGFIKSEDIPVRKNEDKFELSSKYGYKAVEKLFYSAFVSFKTQFSPGYDFPNDSVVVSKFMSPAYLIASLGMDYKPNDEFSLYFSPATGRFIFVQDQDLADKGLYGVEGAVIDTVTKAVIKHGETFKADFGAFVRALYKADIWVNVGLESKLELFNNYTDKKIDNRKNIDVNWETKLVMKVNKFIAANIFLHLIYDQDIKVPIYEKIDGIKTKTGEGMRLQVKEVLGLGFSIKF